MINGFRDGNKFYDPNIHRAINFLHCNDKTFLHELMHCQSWCTSKPYSITTIFQPNPYGVSIGNKKTKCRLFTTHFSQFELVFATLFVSLCFCVLVSYHIRTIENCSVFVRGGQVILLMDKTDLIDHFLRNKRK